MIKYMVEPFLLGITMGGYCAVSCFPFLLPYILTDSKHKFLRKLYVFGQFLLGRLMAYILFAVLISLLAISAEGLLSQRINSLLMVIASLIMINFSLTSTKIPFCQFKKLGGIAKGFPLVTGFILGLNLCPPFLVALVNIIEMQSIFYSCIYFFFLFLGTTIYLLPLVLVSATLKSDFFRRIGIYLGILIGIWFLIQGITGLL